jgi:hypothetical protein
MKNPKLPKLTEVLRHVLKTGQPCPVQDPDVECDLGGDLGCDSQWLISVNKSDFGRYYNVAPGQVTRWIDAGLPVQPDGRLLFGKAAEWIKENRGEWLEERGRREIAAFMAKHGKAPLEVQPIEDIDETPEPIA